MAAENPFPPPETDCKSEPPRLKRYLALFSLVLAGEAVFMPVFYLGRYFQSSMLGVLALNEAQKGELYTRYGAVAMVCYLLGGPLADRVSPRKLIAGSLLATSAGGLYMTTLPSFAELRWLYAFWGASTIFAFWAPLIRATRELGGEDVQGKTFGVLDGGRGLTAAFVAAVSLRGCLAMFGADVLDDPEREVDAVKGLIGFYAAMGVVAAAAVLFFVPDPKSSLPADEELGAMPSAPATASSRGPLAALHRVAAVARLPAIWLQALVVIAAYSAFKTFDQYGLYSEDAYGLTKSQSANLVTWLGVLRIGAALAAGWIADRLLGAAGAIFACFATLLVGFGLLLTLPATAGSFVPGVATIAITCAAFFGLRGVYFALFEENNVPDHLTGAAVGLVSFVGFTPEIFVPLVTGELIKSARDAGDVMLGYQRLFLLLAAASLTGLIAAWLLTRLRKRSAAPSADA